jgi:hypothetical protein
MTTPAQAEQIGTGDVVVYADLRPAQAAEILLSLIGAGTIKAVGFLMVDPLHLETLMQVVPRRSLIRIHYRPLGNPSADEDSGLAFRIEYGWERVAAAFGGSPELPPWRITAQSPSAAQAPRRSCPMTSVYSFGFGCCQFWVAHLRAIGYPANKRIFRLYFVTVGAAPQRGAPSPFHRDSSVDTKRLGVRLPPPFFSR